jgi:hypothetical protein
MRSIRFIWMPQYQSWQSGNQVFHSNGWLENRVERDSLRKQKKIEQQSAEYRNLFATNSFSEYRYIWFCKTIEMLKQRGTVVLLRMPVSTEMQEMEREFFPQFDSLIFTTSRNYDVIYMNMSTVSGCRFDDLHHMESESAILFSAMVGGRLSRVLAKAE